MLLRVSGGREASQAGSAEKGENDVLAQAVLLFYDRMLRTVARMGITIRSGYIEFVNQREM